MRWLPGCGGTWRASWRSRVRLRRWGRLRGKCRRQSLCGGGGGGGFREWAGHGEHHGGRVFGCGDGVAFGGIDDYNSFAGSGGYIDVIYADAGSADDFEGISGLYVFFGHLGATTA